MIRTLFSYFGPHKKIFLVDMFCAVMVAAIDLAFPLVSRYAMYQLLPDRLYHLFFVLMACVAACYLLRSLCYYFMTSLGHYFGILVESDIRADLFAHLQELDFSFYDRNRTGKIMSRLTGDLFEITELAHHGPEDLLISVLTILGALVFMFTIQWRLALVVAILIPIFLLIVMARRRDMATASLGVKKKLAAINAEVESSISGMRTAKAFANEAVDREKFDASNDSFRRSKRGYYRAMGKFNASQEFFMCILPVTVIAYGGYLIMQGQMDYVELITFTLFVTAFVTPIRKMATFAEVFTNGTAGLKRFMEVMAVEPRIKDREGAPELQVAGGEIQVDDVSFAYTVASKNEGEEDILGQEEVHEQEVLQNISLHIRPGESLAIVGPSGGGKTTLCQLIPRFYDVNEGSIRIDGQDVREVTKKSLRQAIGIVQQDVFIFADSILENIRYGRPDAGYEEVVEAAKRARIYDDIMEMPEQFETYVGERGTKLSGGQKQRLSIARIFLKDPRILILDEATSALDTITEGQIQESFEELAEGRTNLIIAHRLATVRKADRIVVIDHGRIVEEGSHEALIKKDGAYAALYQSQELQH